MWSGRNGGGEGGRYFGGRPEFWKCGGKLCAWCRDTSILHHAFISIFIALWAVITHYISILMAILSYFTRFTMKRGNADSWNSGWKRSKHWKPILHCSKNPETPRNMILELIRIIERKKYIRGPTPWPGGWGRAHPYWARPLSPRPPGGPPVSISCYMKAFTLEKIGGKLTGRNSAATRRNLGGTNLELHHCLGL